MATTSRFNFEKFGGGLGGSIEDNGGKFSSTDRDVLDRILSSLEVHAHTGGSRLADPSGPPTATLGTAGGLLPGVTYYYRISYIDRYGLETAASDEVSVTTPPPVDPPIAPIVTTEAGGTLEPGITYWAGTSMAGGVETPLGDPTLLTIEDNFTVNLDFDFLPDGADSIGVWRQGPADAGFTRIGETLPGETTFVDDGSVPGDPCACDPSLMPPEQNLTGVTSSVVIDVPSADTDLVGVAPVGSVLRWRIYRTDTSGVYDPSALVHEVIETTDGTTATGLFTSWEDAGGPLQPGAPLESSTTLTPSQPVGGGGGGSGAGALQVRSTDGTSTWAISATLDGALVTDASGVPVGNDVFLIDANNIKWAVTVDPDGSLRTTAASPGTVDTVLSGAMITTPDPTLAYLLTVDIDGALVTTAAGAAHPEPVTVPVGGVLPSPSTRPDGSIYILDNGDGTGTMYVLSAGVWLSIGGGGGGGGPVGGAGFTDDFTRSDRVLATDNGWFQSVAGSVASLNIVSNHVEIPTGGSGGNQPILHARNDTDPDVADVTITVSRVSNDGAGYIMPVSDLNYDNGININYDGSVGYISLNAHIGGADVGDLITLSGGGVVDHGVYADWTGGTATFRFVYTNSTRSLDIYFNGVLAYEVPDLQATIDVYFGGSVETFPALSTMPYAGFASDTSPGIEHYDDFICV